MEIVCTFLRSLYRADGAQSPRIQWWDWFVPLKHQKTAEAAAGIRRQLCKNQKRKRRFYKILSNDKKITNIALN